jgi:hypothetical protein
LVSLAGGLELFKWTGEWMDGCVDVSLSALFAERLKVWVCMAGLLWDKWRGDMYFTKKNFEEIHIRH